jgi:[acyl-carrier-protein] S-malonyltransferase
MTVRWVAIASGQGGQRREHVEHAARSSLATAWRRAAGDRAQDEAAAADNRVVQPSIVAWQLDTYAAVAAALPPPVLVAGYSVGEIAACAIAGAYAPADAVAIAGERALLMDAAAPYPCALGAILGLAQSAVDVLCTRHGAAIAIRNGARHFVVGGRREAVQALVEDAGLAGATRAHLLPVNTPAHTPLLCAAVAPFAQVLWQRVRSPLRIAAISAIDASRIATPEEVVAALSRQLATTLDWASCMDAIDEMRPDAVLEIGPCNALARMFAEACPGTPVRAVEDFREPAAAAAWVAAQRR